jgi:arginase family enzyme
MGTMAGHLAANPEAVVIWVDAHADINTISRHSTTLLS